MNITSKALNYLKEQQSLKTAKTTQKEKATTREYNPNEYGYYTIQQCYIINNMLANGAQVDANGLFRYTSKDGNTTRSHHITNMTAYNASIEAYETLRQLGIKGCVELYEYGDTIRLVRKIDSQYYITTITGDGIHDEPYNGRKQLMQFIAL